MKASKPHTKTTAKNPSRGKKQKSVGLISIILTTKNEEKNIGKVLSSLVTQEPPIEIIVVDAASTDATQTIVREFERLHPAVTLYIKEGTIGKSFNYGIQKAKGDAISFIGADDSAHKDWIKQVRKTLTTHDVVVGRCLMQGQKKFTELDRVSIYHKGEDISWPGTNTTYKRKVLEEIGGFDTSFITAEDIELNYRVVDAGYKFCYEKKALVYRYSRDNVTGFIRQAFWNGYGRRQLRLKYGRLWSSYSLSNIFESQITFWGLLRLMTGTVGYVFGSVRKTSKQAAVAKINGMRKK